MMYPGNARDPNAPTIKADRRFCLNRLGVVWRAYGAYRAPRIGGRMGVWQSLKAAWSHFYVSV